MPSLRVTYSEPAEAELMAAYAWMSSFGYEVAERWLEGLHRTVVTTLGRLDWGGVMGGVLRDAPDCG